MNKEGKCDGRCEIKAELKRSLCTKWKRAQFAARAHPPPRARPWSRRVQLRVAPPPTGWHIFSLSLGPLKGPATTGRPPRKMCKIIINLRVGVIIITLLLFYYSCHYYSSQLVLLL